METGAGTEKIEIELHGQIAGEVVEFILNFAVFVDNELCARNIEQKGDGWVSAEFKKDQMEVLLDIKKDCPLVHVCLAQCKLLQAAEIVV